MISEMASKELCRAKVRILRRQMVKPAGEQAHEGVLQLTAWDEVFGLQQNQTLFLYSPQPTSPRERVETLAGSLGLALAQFSPIAGRLRWVDQRRHRLEIVCNGEGAELTEAECDEDMSWFRDPCDLDRATALVPEVDYEKQRQRPVEDLPMFAVQITSFRCGGVAVGMSMSHVAADGQAGCHFISEWARLARGEPINEAPSFLYRAMLREREKPVKNCRQMSDHIEYQNPPLKLGKEDAVEEWSKELVKFALPLTKEQLDALKNTASSAATTDGKSCGFSRYQVVSAHIWRCLCKARELEDEQETILVFPVNARNHIRSFPLPPASFGNMIIPMRAQSQAGLLISNDLASVCATIRDAINIIDEEYIWSHFDLLEKQEDLSLFTKDLGEELKIRTKGKPYVGNPNLRVVSWLSLPIRDVNFGWGNYYDIVPESRDVDGSIILLPTPGRSDGSIVVLSCLQKAHADEFKKHFYQDIDM